MGSSIELVLPPRRQLEGKENVFDELLGRKSVHGIVKVSWLPPASVKTLLWSTIENISNMQNY